ncbi:MAG: hypothetical protein ABI560_01560, partial [Myxococcales bacterium]
MAHPCIDDEGQCKGRRRGHRWRQGQQRRQQLGQQLGDDRFMRSLLTLVVAYLLLILQSTVLEIAPVRM